jgi:phosphoribosyl 1,2-cyclic phosphodiesterase
LALRIFVLGTGSSGNGFVVEADGGERLLIDAGIGPNRAIERMRGLGAELVRGRASPSPAGIFVTHDHGDHASHALPLARALRAPIFAHAPLCRTSLRVEVRSYVPGRVLDLGPFSVEALPVPHDAPHVALRVEAGGYRIAIATDVGHARRDLRAFLAACDLVFLESNYCPRLLDAGPYPPSLKRRVGGPLGHLANEQAAEVAAGLEDTRVSRLVLVHVSRTNNTPERAQGVVGARLRRLPVEALAQGESRLYEVEGRRRRAEQLLLPLT